jgi:exo-beta-1,3-glucanase (GH17 family)
MREPLQSRPYFKRCFPAMTLLRCLIAVFFTVFANVAFWGWMGRDIALPDVPGGQFDCLSYTPFEEGSDPRQADDKVSMTTIDADMKALGPVTRCLRVYTSRGATPAVLDSASRHGMKVMLGLWISADKVGNDLEIAAALSLLQRYHGTVTTLVVGNEVLLRRELTYDRLMKVIDDVRAQVTVPVAYADVYEFWARYPDVAQSVDVILVHILPYWDDPAPRASEAQPYLEEVLQRFIKIFPGKTIIIGETGWPSAGPSRGVAVASVVDQAQFVRGFIQRAHALGVSYNLIEALDQPWKRASEGTAGGYWGILTAERQQKFALTGPVSEWPQWRRQAALAAVLGLLLGGFALKRAAGWRIFAVALAAQLLATVIVMLWRYIHEVSLGLLGSTIYQTGLFLSLLSGLAVLDLLSRGSQSWLAVKPVSLREVFQRIGQKNVISDSAVMAPLLHFSVAFPAAILTLTLAVSARHRDVPWLLLVMPAVLAVLLWWQQLRACHLPQEREEAWLALMLLVGGGFCWWAMGSGASAAWALAVWLLALPWLQALRVLGGSPLLALRSSR